MRSIKQDQIVDFEVQGTTDLANPFFAEVYGIFNGPQGQRLVVPGFYAGSAAAAASPADAAASAHRWVVRFSPRTYGADPQGQWTYAIASPHVRFAQGSGAQGSVFLCVPAADPALKGVLRVSPEHPYHFRYDDGSYHFMNAYECDWLWALDLGRTSTARTQALVDKIVAASFTEVIMNVYAHDSTWTAGITGPDDYGPPAMYAWGGTNEKPDHSRINLKYYAHYDAVMEILRRAGLTAHIFLKVYNKQVNWPKKGSPEDDLYFSYLVARYQAYPNVIWDFAKESYNETDKEYLFDRLELVKRLDAYGHLRTTHDDIQYCSNPRWAAAVDFYTAQQHYDFYSIALVDKFRYRKPYFNSELGYEYGPGGPTDKCYDIVQSPEEVVKRAYLVVMAGGYPAYYYTHTAWDVIKPEHTPPGYAYWKILADFFGALRFWEFEPAPGYCRIRAAKCLAREAPGGRGSAAAANGTRTGFARDDAEELVFFSDQEDRNTLWMTNTLDFSRYTGYWMDILGGEKQTFAAASIKISSDGLDRMTVANPFSPHPAVLYLKRT